MSSTLTQCDLGKIERWARAYMNSKPHGFSYWDLHGNDSKTYRKVCKLLNIPSNLKILTKNESQELELKELLGE